MKQTDVAQLAFKREADPQGLVNAGNTVAWDDPAYDDRLGKTFLFRLRRGHRVSGASMRVLVLYAHPDPESYVAALHRAAVGALAEAGHEVDDCDLYAEGFDPILSREERLRYHDLGCNRAPVEAYVRRLEAAEALVLVFPVWNFGLPAILKGFLDRVFLPGVSFRLENGLAVPNLHHLSRLTAIVTYGAPRWRAFAMGDPPRKIVTRMLRILVAPRARVRYFAAYDMNRATPARRTTFLADVGEAMRRA